METEEKATGGSKKKKEKTRGVPPTTAVQLPFSLKIDYNRTVAKNPSDPKSGQDSEQYGDAAIEGFLQGLLSETRHAVPSNNRKVCYQLLSALPRKVLGLITNRVICDGPEDHCVRKIIPLSVLLSAVTITAPAVIRYRHAFYGMDRTGAEWLISGFGDMGMDYQAYSWLQDLSRWIAAKVKDPSKMIGLTGAPDPSPSVLPSDKDGFNLEVRTGEKLTISPLPDQNDVTKWGQLKNKIEDIISDDVNGFNTTRTGYKRLAAQPYTQIILMGQTCGISLVKDDVGIYQGIILYRMTDAIACGAIERTDYSIITRKKNDDSDTLEDIAKTAMRRQLENIIGMQLSKVRTLPPNSYIYWKLLPGQENVEDSTTPFDFGSAIGRELWTKFRSYTPLEIYEQLLATLKKEKAGKEVYATVNSFVNKILLARANSDEKALLQLITTRPFIEDPMISNNKKAHLQSMAAQEYISMMISPRRLVTKDRYTFTPPQVLKKHGYN